MVYRQSCWGGRAESGQAVVGGGYAKKDRDLLGEDKQSRIRLLLKDYALMQAVGDEAVVREG